VAADFVINGWLVEMGVGQVPDGVLHDAKLKGMSAEAVYEPTCVGSASSPPSAAVVGATCWANGCLGPVSSARRLTLTISTDAR
jgi:hypothetical protein